MDEHEDESPEMKLRRWDSDFLRWLNAGMPEKGTRNFVINPKPGKHPVADHEWNTDQENFLKKLKTDPDEAKFKGNRDDFEEY